ncbi:C40 family peptidase [Corynebacterium sp. ES2794-CONJ1]|uniref:C40 family peptidase n=1 Tax=Corynebacterium sp. ES2794-CONJ1 TaxID=2980553 RepID=UPI0021D8A38A|nr:C40 family peptidase [Corynebacterium sp. ES2794-CONJ1]MCU9518822.1 C40 family peptidase [Corynebacterium sp. ES2794-CONJ1]
MMDFISEAEKLLQPLNPAPLPQVPNFEKVGPLAQEFGVEPAVFLAENVNLIRDTVEAGQTVLPALGLINQARIKLQQLACKFFARAIALLSQVAVPNPAISGPALTMLLRLPAQFLTQAYCILEQLKLALSPYTKVLEDVSQRGKFLTLSTQRMVTKELIPALKDACKAADILPPTISSLDSESSGEQALSSTSHSPDQSQMRGHKAVEIARSAIGTPYQWGGTSRQGFDCSGLTQWAWRQAGVELPRIASEQAVGQPISREDLAPGDLLVWSGHVAMYSGDGMIIEAGNPVSENPLRTTNMGMDFKGFFRPQ